MSLDERLSRAAHHIAEGVTAPTIDPESVRSTARATRRRSLSLATAVSVIVLLVAVIALLGGREMDAPLPASPVPPPPATGAPEPARPLPTEGVLAPGTYAIVKPGTAISDYQQLTVTVPAGWSSSDGRIGKRLNQPGEVALSVWTIRSVYDNPCRWQTSSVSQLDLADDTLHQQFHETVTGAAVAGPSTGGLANQALRNASPLISAEIGGESAVKVQMSVPARLNLAECDQGQLRAWVGVGSATDANSHHVPGQIDTIYMVDLDRGALVVDASHLLDSSAADVAELDAVLASMIIDRGP